MRGKLMIGIVLFSMLSLILGACTEVAEDTNELEDTRWVLESYGPVENPKTVLEGTEITAIFESAEKQLRGSAGCNTYFGEYEIVGNQVSIYQLAYTEMACMEPEGVMEQESEYLGILQKAKSFEVENGLLRITTDSQLLVFSAQ